MNTDEDNLKRAYFILFMTLVMVALSVLLTMAHAVLLTMAHAVRQQMTLMHDADPKVTNLCSCCSTTNDADESDKTYAHALRQQMTLMHDVDPKMTH